MRWRTILWGLVIVCAVATVAYAADVLLYVQVETTRVRSQPNFFMGKQLAMLKHGDRVERLEEKGSWSKVRCPDGRIGWISTSALTEKKVVLKAGDKDVKTGVDQEELALAGRGFSRDVEGAYRRQNAALDYRWVDYMERDRAFQVEPKDMVEFLRAGGLLPAEGGAE